MTCTLRPMQFKMSCYKITEHFLVFEVGFCEEILLKKCHSTPRGGNFNRQVTGGAIWMCEVMP